jgi:hypothetical protein
MNKGHGTYSDCSLAASGPRSRKDEAVFFQAGRWVTLTTHKIDRRRNCQEKKMVLSNRGFVQGDKKNGRIKSKGGSRTQETQEEYEEMSGNTTR